MHTFCEYNNDQRRNSMHWTEEDTILSGSKRKRNKRKSSSREIFAEKSD